MPQDTAKILAIRRELNIRKARENFWAFCCMLAPDFYKKNYWHLHLICETLQALYERRLTGKTFRYLCDALAPEWYVKTVEWDRLQDDKVYTKLIENIPPRHGKSRTLVMFCEWVLGINRKERIITASYNDSLASDFSRFCRDGIVQQKNLPFEIVYSDMFPNTRISKGNASFMSWALQGEFFSYKAAGVGGSVTGRGASVLICDDVVKDAEESFNENALEKIWLWYTSTLSSRLENTNNGGIEILNMTRWSKNDPCGKLLSSSESNNWLVLLMPACSPAGEMLCNEILPKDKFDSIKRIMDPVIFASNYMQIPIDAEGRLYQTILTYTDLPKDEKGNLLTTQILAYCDTADTGEDFLACIVAHIYKGEAYVVDILYDNRGMEVTEGLTAKMLYDNKVNLAVFESNNGGKLFSKNIDRIIYDKYKTRATTIRWFHESRNKEARILSASTGIMSHVYFPTNFRDKWPEAYLAMISYVRTGKNRHDDFPDCLSGLWNQVCGGQYSGFIQWLEDKKNAKNVDK
jgi:predicted phage terminase large subunit-like protein